MITAKVFCASKREQGQDDDRNAVVTFSADYADDRNKEWAKWTPNLNMTMTLNGQAADLFEQGKKYTLQFVEDEQAEAMQADYLAEAPDAATHHPDAPTTETHTLTTSGAEDTTTGPTGAPAQGYPA